MKAEETRQVTTHTEGSAQNADEEVTGAEIDLTTDKRTKAEMLCAASCLMEAIVERSNLMAAYQRVVQNKGSAGVDGIDVTMLKDYLKQHWPMIRVKLLTGQYMPSAVRCVEIPKPQGGVRMLGIPTLLDRLIQQAMHQVLSPIFEKEFSASSYGFRPGKNAHQAVASARQHVSEGRRFVVDIDLEKFFDQVNHDILMGKLAKKIGDKRVLKLIRRYLTAGMMAGGVVSPRSEGTPQGGPLSPLLSNVLLDGLDKELAVRGHAFCRYADDCNIYVKSKRAGERVMARVSRFVKDKLKLKVNETKSAVARPWERKFLGYSMTWHKAPKLRVALASHERFKESIRELLRASKGCSLQTLVDRLNPKLRGWVAYFKLTETKQIWEELDGWIRRRLRCRLWRYWKRPYTRAKKLMQAGLAEERAWRSACNQRGPWYNSGTSHMNHAFPKSYFDRLGLVSLRDTAQRLQCAS